MEKAVWFPPIFFMFLVGSAIVTAKLGRAHENILTYSALEIGVGIVAFGFWKLATSILRLGPIVSCSTNGIFFSLVACEWNHMVTIGFDWTKTISVSTPIWIGLGIGAALGTLWELKSSGTARGRRKEY